MHKIRLPADDTFLVLSPPWAELGPPWQYSLLALMLLVGSGLLIRAFWNLRTVDAGLRSDHLLTARLALTSPAPDRPAAGSIVNPILGRSITTR